MATTDEERLRQELSAERDELAEAVQTLRARIRSKVPLVAAGTLGLAFVATGGLRATLRVLFRRR
jgi:hypothetical protein